VPERLVFDSEAILAFYLGEEEGKVVKDSLEKVQNGDAEGYINILNLAEFYYILCRVDPGLAEEKERNLRLFGLEVIPIEDDELWREAATIKAKHTLSLADAFAASTAKILESELVVGSDEEFRGLGVQLLRIRNNR
jgi:ribonuclease VapC